MNIVDFFLKISAFTAKLLINMFSVAIKIIYYLVSGIAIGYINARESWITQLESWITQLGYINAKESWITQLIDRKRDYLKQHVTEATIEAQHLFVVAGRNAIRDYYFRPIFQLLYDFKRMNEIQEKTIIEIFKVNLNSIQEIKNTIIQCKRDIKGNIYNNNDPFYLFNKKKAIHGALIKNLETRAKNLEEAIENIQALSAQYITKMELTEEESLFKQSNFNDHLTPYKYKILAMADSYLNSLCEKLKILERSQMPHEKLLKYADLFQELIEKKIKNLCVNTMGSEAIATILFGEYIMPLLNNISSTESCGIEIQKNIQMFVLLISILGQFTALYPFIGVEYDIQKVPMLDCDTLENLHSKLDQYLQSCNLYESKVRASNECTKGRIETIHRECPSTLFEEDMNSVKNVLNQRAEIPSLLNEADTQIMWILELI